jgi:hypothetical protein
MTTNEADRTDERGPASDVFAPDEAADEPEADEFEQGDEIEQGDESQSPTEVEPSALEEPETGPAGVAEEDTVVDGDPPDTEPRSSDAATGEDAPGVDEPLLADATGYQDRWYEIQTGFVDEPRHAVQSAGELLTEMMDDLTRRLTTELERFDAQRGAHEDVSTEDLRVTFQRYRLFFDRLLAA